MSKISVIIPVYNVEEYLGECLDSIINQTFKDLEIICINDGSKDNSLQILKKYSEKDERIIIIDQENGGHAAATNRGINQAKGKYLFLMDSDDKLKLDCLEKTFNAAEEKDVDFVLFQAINYDNEQNKYFESEYYSMNEVADYVGDNIFSFDDLGDLCFKITVTPWTKLYNKEFVEKSHVRFPEGLIFDDNIFFWEIFLQAKRVYFLKEHLFYRRWYESSSTMAGDLRFTDSIAINTMVLDVFEKYGKFNEFYRSRLFNRKVRLTGLRFMQIKDEYKEIYFDEMQKNFRFWIEDNEFYEYLLEILIPENRFMLESIIKSQNAKELKYLIENYELKAKSKKLLNIDSSYRQEITKNEKLIQEKNRLIEENEKLSKRNDELTETIDNLVNVNDEKLNSKSWKITKPLRAFNRISKEKRR